MPVRASGVVQDVVYLGSVNHYLVGLDGGTTLTVLRQNLRGDTHESMARRGERVELAWDDAHLIDLTGGALAAGAATHEGEPT